MIKDVRLWALLLPSVVLAGLVPTQARATFHHMQIEQLILGVNGDNAAQAVQLRLREANENQVGNASLWAYDQLGFNKTALIDQFPSNVSNAAAGARILIATPRFALYTSTPLQADFTMNPVPASFLNAGRVTFENYLATLVFWGFAYGGDAYLGPTTGAAENDADGNYGVFPTALPNTGVAARFQGPATAMSTTNAADYLLTTGSTIWTNNAGQQFTVTPSILGDYNRNGTVDAADYVYWRNNFGSTNLHADGDKNGTVNNADYGYWRTRFGNTSSAAAAASDFGAVPEPSLSAMLGGVSALALLGIRRRS